MKQLLILVILFLLVPALVLAEEPVRTWTTVSGKTLSAVWVTDSDVGEGKIRLRAGSQFFRIRLDQLSEADQEYVKERLAAKIKTPAVDMKQLESQLKGKFQYQITGNSVTITRYIGNSSSVTIPYGVTTIGWLAFFKCENLTSVTIPDSVTAIEARAFEGCENLQSVTIPDSVTTIGEDAFSGCSSLTSVTIPDSVTVIGEGGPFFHCDMLTDIHVSLKNKCFKSIDGVLFTADGKKLIRFPQNKQLSQYVIPQGVTAIGWGAFMDCKSLTSVTIPNSVTTIGLWAFAYSGLTSVTIPDSVTAIGESAFMSCSRLTSVTIPDSVTTIGKETFQFCHSLTSVTIPDSVTTIGVGAFWFCPRLTSVTIPNSVTTIGASAFYGCSGLTSVTIPNSVTTIGFQAFSGCKNLRSITIPDSVLGIGKEAFSDCGGLTIYGKAGSEAELYVKENPGLRFQAQP